MARLGKRCKIRVRGIPNPTWLKGVWLSEKKAIVTENHPLWHGSELDCREAEIKLDREEDGRRLNGQHRNIRP